MKLNDSLDFFSLFRKKILIIFFFSLVCAVGLGLEKYLTNDFVAKTNKFYVCELVRFENNKDRQSVNPLNYSKILKTSGSLYGFIETNEKNRAIDFEKLDANWNKLDKYSKIIWLHKNLTITDFNEGACEFVLNLDQFTPKDSLYLTDKAFLIIDSFVNYSGDYINKVSPETRMKVIDRFVVTPEEVILPKRKIIFKYSIIGFIFGGILSSLSVAIWAIGKRKNGI